jgi:hypothetical protein
MKQSHWLIAGASIVSLGIGYIAGGSRASSAGAVQTAGKSSNPVNPRSSSRDRQTRENSDDELLAGILKGRAARDLSDAELAKIVLQLSKYDPSQNPIVRARQLYQLQLLLAKLPVSRLEQAAQAIAADPESKRSGALNMLVAALAAKDPREALAWAKEQKNSSSLLASVIGTMAKDDPMAAADLYRNGLLDGTFDNGGWQASYGVGVAMAQLGAKPLLAFIDSLPRQQQGNILSNACRELPESDRLTMMDEISQRTKDGRLDDWCLKNVFPGFIASNPAQAEAWLAKMEPGKERASLALSAAATLSQTGDPEAAQAWMARAIADSPGKEKELLNEVVSQLGYSSPKGIAVFASLLPAGIELRADDLKSQANHSTYNGFRGLSAMAGAIRDPAEQAQLITGALDQFTTTTGQSSQPVRLNAADFEILTRQLATLNLSGDNAAKVEQALAAAKAAKAKPRE